MVEQKPDQLAAISSMESAVRLSTVAKLGSIDGTVSIAGVNSRFRNPRLRADLKKPLEVVREAISLGLGLELE